MLGLGASCNNDEGYAKGERYRERFHTGGIYHLTTNPIGKLGKESDYFGDFADSEDDDNFITSSALKAVDNGTLRVITTLGNTNGYASININALSNIQYKLTVLYDPNDEANDNGEIKVFDSAGTELAATGALGSSAPNTTQTLTYTHTTNKGYVSIRFYTARALKQTFYDNISVKEA